MKKRTHIGMLGWFLFVWWTPAFPCFAAPPTLDEVLLKTGGFVENYWLRLSHFKCTESVTQEKIGNQGKVIYTQNSIFDYLTFAKGLGDDLTIEESRVRRNAAASNPKQPSLLTTNGFPTLLLILHPLYQANYQFQFDEDDEQVAGTRSIRFEHIPGMRSTTAMLLQGIVHPLELRGTALIDSTTGAVLKIAAELIAPMKSINIEAFRAEVRYQLQRFSSRQESAWLPSAAAIEVDTALQHWRNIHRFSEYRHFTVQSLEAITQ
jgi:hypothetical protein